MYNAIFRKNVLRVLEDLHMTRKELSEKSGVSISFLAELAAGKANPSIKTMQSIAEALNTPLPFLLIPVSSQGAGGGGQGTERPAQWLPEGFERVAAVLPEHQAFIVRRWREASEKLLQKNHRKRKPN